MIWFLNAQHDFKNSSKESPVLESWRLLRVMNTNQNLDVRNWGINQAKAVLALKKQVLGARLAEFMPEKFSFEQIIPRNPLYLVCVPAAFTKARHRSGTFSCSPHGARCWALSKSKYAAQFRPPVQTEMLPAGCHNGKKNGQCLPGKVKLALKLPKQPWVSF